MNNILNNNNNLDESNLIINKRINEVNTSHNYNFFCKIIILMLLFLILNFVFIIKIFVLLKNRDLIINKTIEIESGNNHQINGVNLYDPPLEETDLYILNRILKKNSKYIELTLDEQKFFNGLLRRIKPKKIIEIGVSSGGSANLILNAIKDIEGAKLYSIDLSKKAYKFPSKEVGFAVKENFPELMNKWTLFKGGVTSEFIEKIGGNIELAFIDTAHVTPGEKLDWLQVLPFLKEEAIVVFHDTFIMNFLKDVTLKKHFTNIHLLTYIRGELILPKYRNSVFSRNIGALKLTKNQNKYYKQYFLALGEQWDYMPREGNIKAIRKFFTKYYGYKYAKIFDDAVINNKKHLSLK